MTVRVEIDLEEDQKAQLDELATGRGGAAADLIVEAVRNYLEEADYRAGVERGLAALEAGDVLDWTDAERELRAYVDDRYRRAAG
jgi:predicted transcriptional regulator